jgi:hypothetical protein
VSLRGEVASGMVVISSEVPLKILEGQDALILAE